MDTNRPKKKFGQNFLQSDVILKKIIQDSGVSTEDHVIEIGPGRGALTKYLVKSSKSLTAFEIDTTLTSYLNPLELLNPHFKVIYQDILEVDLDAYIQNHIGSKVKVIANIPYYITSPIIFKLLESTWVSEATLLIQKEVADRIVANEKTGDYGSLSIMINYQADVKKLVQVKRTAFYPVPNVDSTVIQIIKHRKYQDLIQDEALFVKLVKASFTQKRKTLINNLIELFGGTKDELLQKLKTIDEKYDTFTRAESLSIEDFIRLSNGWKS
jgi:16S rRNA (adenine1518-N6/adenine1519-N6)-dimethyltransferase